LWAVVDSADPAKGGVSLTYASVPVPSGDPNTCPGSSNARSLQLVFLCNSTLAKNVVYVHSARASPFACVYAVVLETGSACTID